MIFDMVSLCYRYRQKPIARYLDRVSFCYRWCWVIVAMYPHSLSIGAGGRWCVELDISLVVLRVAFSAYFQIPGQPVYSCRRSMECDI